MSRICLTAISVLLVLFNLASAKEYHLDTFEPVQMTDVYYSEGISYGDINGDGAVVYSEHLIFMRKLRVV